MNRFRTILTVLLTVLLVFTSPAAYSETIGFDTLFSGNVQEALSICFSSPEYVSLAQFGEERLQSLNRLIKYFSFDIRINGDVSETDILLDGGKVFSIYEEISGSSSRTVYSFDPEHVYEHPTDNPDSAFAEFLDKQFFMINRLLDQMYPLLKKTTETFPNLTKTSEEKMNYKEFGKAVRKDTILFPSDYVSAYFPQILSDLLITDECKQFVSQFVFNGPQKIVLYYGEDGNILRVNYDGVLGTKEDSFRKVSLSWRCLRSDGHVKDILSLKTPSIKGYDKYNLSYERNHDMTDKYRHTASWDFQLDLKAGETKKKIRYNADLLSDADKVTGEAVFSEKQDGTENKITFIPDIRKENDRDYSGTLEITDISGKIITSSIRTRLQISPCEMNAVRGNAATSTDIPYEEEKYTDEEIQSFADRILIHKLLSLPEEDLDFLNRDIPDNVWETIIQSLF